MVVQLLGMLAGSPVIPGELHDFGFLMLGVQPGLLGSQDEFKHKVADYADIIRGTRPLAVDSPVRMPFDRSAARRKQQIRKGGFEVPDEVYQAISALAGDS